MLACGPYEGGLVGVVDGIKDAQGWPQERGGQGRGILWTEAKAGGMEEKIGFLEGSFEQGKIPSKLAEGESLGDERCQFLQEFIRARGISVNQGERAATGAGQKSGDGLADAATAQEKDSIRGKGVWPNFKAGAKPAGGVGAGAMNLALDDLDGVNRFGLESGGVVL